MKADLFKKILLAVAGLALIAIWSRNLLLFFPRHQEKDRRATSSTMPTSSHPYNSDTEPESLFVFADGIRDPFQVPSLRPASADTVKRRRPKPPPPEPPHAALIGIVWNAKAPHVVVYDSLTNASVILKLKEWINGYQVRTIEKKRVTLRSNRQLFVWETDE